MANLPRRIAFCITELDPGGAEHALVQIVTRLDRDRWEPRIYCLSGRGQLVEPLEAADVPVHCLGATSQRDWGVIRRLRRELRAFRPDVLQSFLFHANMAGRLAAWRTGVPLVVSGTRVVEGDARWRMWLDRATQRLVTHNVCVSEAVASRYQHLGYPNAKLSVIANGVDAERISSATPADLTGFGVTPPSRTMLAVGRLHPQKGIDVLIQSCRTLLGNAPNLHLLIAGDGPQRNVLEQQAAATAVHERIHFLGRRNDVPSLMRACDVFVLPSRWEGMPNVLLEAMAARLPVVATDVEGVRELIVDGESGLIVPPESPQALVKAVSTLLIDPARATTMAATAWARVREHFTWERTTERYSDLWLELLRRQTAR